MPNIRGNSGRSRLSNGPNAMATGASVGLNNYVAKLVDVLAGDEDVLRGTGRGHNGEYQIENLPARDGSSGLTSGYEDQIGDVNPGKPGDDFFSGGRWHR